MLLPQQQQQQQQRKRKVSTKASTTMQTKASRGYGDAPIFLKKTYEMIDTCGPEVATWSKDGTTFIIKNPDKFESEEIPKFFNHRNFSSFVRQLNFYGFRKIKTDPIRISDRPDKSSEEFKYWVFRHEKFLRGRPDLLSEVKKASQVKAAAQGEVDALKEEVRDLKSQLAVVTKNVDQLMSLVERLTRNPQQEYGNDQQQHGRHSDRIYVKDEPASKKRRVSVSSPSSPSPVLPPSPVQSRHSIYDDKSTIRPSTVTSLPPLGQSNDTGTMDESLDATTTDMPPLPSAPDFSTEREDSVGSTWGTLSDYDEDIIAELLALDDDVSNDTDAQNSQEMPEPTPDAAVSSSTATPTSGTKSTQQQSEKQNDGGNSDDDEQLAEKVRRSLHRLPKNLQDRYNANAPKKSFRDRVAAVSALARAAAEKANEKASLNTTKAAQ